MTGILCNFSIGLLCCWFNHSLLQNNSPYKSVFWFLPPSLDTYWFQVILSIAQPIYFGLLGLLPGFLWNTFFMVLSSDILSRRPAHLSLLSVTVVTIFGFIYITCNSSLVWIFQPFWSFIGPYVFLSIFCCHVSKGWIHLLCHCPHFTTI